MDTFDIYVNTSNAFSDQDWVASVQAVDNTGQVATSFRLDKLSYYLSKGVPYFVSVRAVAMTGLKSDFSASAAFSF